MCPAGRRRLLACQRSKPCKLPYSGTTATPRQLSVQRFTRLLAKFCPLLLQYPRHVQVLRANHVIVPDIVRGQLVQEVPALVGHLLVQFREGKFGFLAPFRHLLLPGEFLLESLDFREGLLEVLRTRGKVHVRVRGEMSDAEVDPNCPTAARERGFHVDRRARLYFAVTFLHFLALEANKPFSCARSLDDDALDLELWRERSVENYPNCPDF